MASEYVCGDCHRFLSGRCNEEDEEGEICDRFEPEEKEGDACGDKRRSCKSH